MFLTHGYTTCWVAFKLAGPTVLNLLALGMALAQNNVYICAVEQPPALNNSYLVCFLWLHLTKMKEEENFQFQAFYVAAAFGPAAQKE